MKTVHLIGIGGIGMSGLARMYLAMGWRVQGSDVKKNDILSGLEKSGARIFAGHHADHVRGSDVVVYSSAVGQNHPERRAAVQGGIRLLHRSEALAEMCEGKFTIAVTGTHGKTTTTAMVGMILREAGRDPSIVVGGTVDFFGGNAVYGKGGEMVIEADESDSSFLNFRPNLEIITNIEEEHMDHFKNIGDIQSAYRNFIARMPAGGHWFGCAEDAGVAGLMNGHTQNATFYGFKKTAGQLSASDIVECPDEKRGVRFQAWIGQTHLGPVEMKIVGRHNVLNALGAIGVGLKRGVSFAVIASALAKYEGAGRRFQVKYEDADFLIVDDYAHHPTEIQKTLRAAKALKKKRIVALFQPHRFSRTEAFMREFGQSFFDADKLIVTEIYAASEEPKPGVDGTQVCRSAQAAGHSDATFVERSRVTEVLRAALEPGDLVITLGAGDITCVAEEISSLFKPSLFKDVRGKVLTDEVLCKHTSLKVGGPAEFWIEPEDAEDLKAVLKITKEQELPFFVLGGGSNVLAPDEGVRGVVAHLGSAYFREIFEKDGRVIARAGVNNSLFIQFALEHGYGDFEFLSGIPGCIGGAVAMNAGSHGQSIDSILEAVTVIDNDQNFCTLRKEELGFSYRRSQLSGAVVVDAVFVMPRRAREEVKEKLNEYHLYRAKTQDLQHPSAGCMFKNPVGLDRSSGKLIDDAGLKGKRIGNAQVSDKHANFIVNLGGASSHDILRLIREVKEAVREKWGVELETEVKTL